MSRVVVNQEANANFLVRRERDFKRFSMTSVRSPVSMALELATARKMLARDTDTLPEFFLRTMGRLRNKMAVGIITLGERTVPSVFTQAFHSQTDTNASLSSEPESLSSMPNLQSGNSDHYHAAGGARLMENLTKGLRLIMREQFAESDRLETEIKRNLGGLGYEL